MPSLARDGPSEVSSRSSSRRRFQAGPVTSVPQSEVSSTVRPARGFWPRLVMRWLQGVQYGQIRIIFPGGATHVARGAEPGADAAITIKRNRAVRRMLARGDVGFAEAFMDGDWSTPDLLAVLDFGYQNETALAGPMKASALFSRLLRFQHRLRANTRSGAKRNIAYHYDLGNEFYGHWLDETMTYSSGLFGHETASLTDAQIRKYRRIIHSLELQPADHVLEIGCGWGGFAELAASETGCRVTGITLSKEQAAFSSQRMKANGLDDRVEIRIQDYRDVPERFDKVVSIEMFEAVGEENWPVYFRAVRDRLRPSGRANLQIITVADDRFEAYRANIDFIRRYIFPGGMLPTKSILADEIKAAGMRLKESFFFGLSYAETLNRWRERFQQRWAQIVPLGFDERFFRMWSYYLCGSEASFRAETTDVGQFLIQRDS